MSEDRDAPPEGSPWDEGLSEEDKAELAKFLFNRRNSPNDFRSPEGVYTSHDRLRALCASVTLALPKDDALREEMNRLQDVVEDHERLIRLMLHVLQALRPVMDRLKSSTGMFQAKHAHGELMELLAYLDTESAKLYLDEI